ncbi:MAG: phosphatidylserine synthase [Oleispira sp.]|jgi:phosphatidylserine synthase
MSNKEKNTSIKTPSVIAMPAFIIKLNRVDLITLSSVLTTFVAMMNAIDGHVYFAMALLFLAMTADALDGLLARKWGLEREFGRYLDGFMDVLIYLVVPSIIMLQWQFDGYWSIFILLMIACGCIRLSVFNQVGNVEATNTSSGNKKLAYKGMPVFWSVFILAAIMMLEKIIGLILSHILLAMSLTVFSFYMIVDKAFFKFSSLTQILILTLGGFVIFTLFSLQQYGLKSPINSVLLALYLQIPVVIGGVLHMVVVKRNYLSAFVIPIHSAWFGANKTWRGLVVVPLLTALGGLCMLPLEWLLVQTMGTSLLSQWNLAYLGFIAGIGYVLAELPNSFFKRRMGIQAGAVPEHKKYWFIALDQLDSALGVAIAYWLVLGISFETAWVYIISFPITALLIKQWLFNKKLKSSAI